MTDINRLIYGKNSIEKIVSAEVTDSSVELFIQQPDGSVKSEFKPNKFWLVANRQLDSGFQKLEGNQFYKYIKNYELRDDFLLDRSKYYKNSTFNIFNPKESAMVKYGFTYHKSLTPADVTVLSFDIETTTLEHNSDSKVLLIANTLRKAGKVTRKMFCYDDYQSVGLMIHDWCDWVCSVDPTIVTGHNVNVFDLPYLQYCSNGELNLGRNGSAMTIDSRASHKRKDGSQSYEYHKLGIYGREIVDTFFLAIDYDIATKKYDNYKLKNIIKQENLEVSGRQFYDAETIRDNYKNPVEWEKIKKYAEHDGDDALALFDLMAPSKFYFTQSVPKSFQAVTESATGSQLNAMMIRSYLQEGHSLPLDSDPIKFEGGISFGVPGLYKNVLKVDLKSAYPSQILRFKLYDKLKDPNANFLKMVEFFTNQRFEQKAEYKKTGNTYYLDREQAAKIFINSAYGLCNTPGLLFNMPHIGEKIAKETRDVIDMALLWASGKGKDYWIEEFERKTK